MNELDESVAILDDILARMDEAIQSMGRFMQGHHGTPRDPGIAKEFVRLKDMRLRIIDKASKL